MKIIIGLIKFTLLGALLAVSTCCAYRSLSYPSILTKEGDYAIGVVGREAILCQTAVRTACGIRLSDCVDLNIYECVSDVKVFNLSNLFRGPSVAE